MRIPRLDAVVVLVLATTAVILPFLDWYAARAPRGELRVSGVTGSPELWVVVALGVLAVSAAIAVSARPEPAFTRPLAIALVVAGIAMTAWSLEAYYDVPVTLSVADGGTARDLSVEVVRRWPGVAGVALSAGLVVVGIVMAWPRRRP
jgi:hypothetical protein